ncbi:MAG: hypothetical protein E6Z15_27895, partial [Paenibacillus macerans]|nr:hypothetical protein [Paenibacillus macerans]
MAALPNRPHGPIPPSAHATSLLFWYNSDILVEWKKSFRKREEKRMKPIGKLFLAAAILAGGITGAGLPQANAAAKVQIMLDGYPLAFSGEPIIVDGTTMVPFRSISESLGI